MSVPELLVHAEEVDLRHVHGLVVDAGVHGDSRDHAHEGAGLGRAHAHVPVLHVAGGSQGPLQKGDRVVEPVVVVEMRGGRW